MIDGNEKGQRYMRLICKDFAKWLGGEWKPRPTIVEPMEGFRVKGDLSSRGVKRQPFVVECKKHEKWVLDGLFDAPKWPVWAWWEQCVRQAREVGSQGEEAIPLLIFTRNRRKNYVLAEAPTIEWLKPLPKHGPLVWIERPEGKLGLVLLDDLVETRLPRKRRSSPGSG